MCIICIFLVCVCKIGMHRYRFRRRYRSTVPVSVSYDTINPNFKCGNCNNFTKILRFSYCDQYFFFLFFNLIHYLLWQAEKNINPFLLFIAFFVCGRSISIGPLYYEILRSKYWYHISLKKWVSLLMETSGFSYIFPWPCFGLQLFDLVPGFDAAQAFFLGAKLGQSAQTPAVPRCPSALCPTQPPRLAPRRSLYRRTARC